MASGSSLGGIVFPIMVTQLISRVGFGWAMRTCAFLILVLLVFANATVTSRLAPTKRPFSVLAFVRPLKEPTFFVLTAALFFFYCKFVSTNLRTAKWLTVIGGMFIPFTYIVVAAKGHGMSTRLSNYLVPILNAARCVSGNASEYRVRLWLTVTSMIGRTIPNAIADKVGYFNVMIIMCGFTTILILGLWLPATGNVPTIIFAALFGLGSGAGLGLSPALCAQVSPIEDIGIRTGTALAIASFAALTGSPIGGQIIAISHGSFQNTVIFAGVSCAIGTALFILCRYMLRGVSMTKI